MIGPERRLLVFVFSDHSWHPNPKILNHLMVLIIIGRRDMWFAWRRGLGEPVVAAKEIHNGVVAPQRKNL